MKAVLYHQERRKWLCLVLAALLTMAVAVPGGTLAQEPTAPCPQMPPLYPAEMAAPDSCGVPLGGPFGKDVEILLNDVQYELEPGWHPRAGIPCAACPDGFSEPSSDVAAASLGTERIAAVWRESGVASHEGELYYNIWDTSGGWGGEEDWINKLPNDLTPEGNPAFLATRGHGWEVYARDSDGQIQYTAWLSPTEFSEWRPVTGTKHVASDPVVVSRRPNHIAVFYHDDSGRVWFTEREGGVVWRESPLPLTPPHRAFLPIVITAGSETAAGVGATSSPGWQAWDADSPSVFSSELSAISRNENHLAVFGVDRLGQLWVKEWTTLNASDWSDTHWFRLMKGVALEKPAVASRHSNHLAVAVRDRLGVAHHIEWPAQTETGWGSPVSLDEAFVGPLTLAATDNDAMFLFGLDEWDIVRSMYWTVDGGWGEPGPSLAAGGEQVGPMHWTVDEGWEQAESGPKVVVQDQVISAVVRRADDVMFLARYRGEHGKYEHYTTYSISRTERDLHPPQREFYRNQVLAWVDGRRYYLAADGRVAGSWLIEAYDLDGDVEQAPFDLGVPYSGSTPVSVAAGDLDFDGNDELVVATKYNDPFNLLTLDVLDLSVTNGDTLTPTLTIQHINDVDEWERPIQDLSVAVGDLDGDGRRNEVLVAVARTKEYTGDDWPLEAEAKLYQFSDGELKAKSDGFQVIVDPNDSPFEGHWELEVAAGRLDRRFPGEQLAVAISGERACRTGCDWLVGFVNVYRIETGGEHWEFDRIHHNVAQAEGDPLEFEGSPGNLYRSAIATADLDADGYQEIAAWYVDRIYAIDPNEPGVPTIEQKVLEPKRPANNAQYFQSPRSLALDDIDRDGRAEILAAAWLKDENTGDFGFRFALLELLGDGVLDVTSYGWSQPGRQEGTVLVGDVDGDGLVSELVGCNTVGEYTVVAVVNGLPRWYENGVPVFDSQGSYSVEQGGGSAKSSGTTYNIGGSLTVGFEREINIPFVGKVASFRASVTQDFLSSSGISEDREDIFVFGSDFSFEDGLGLVVYSVVEGSCYYYDVFSPDSPGDRSRAMSCKPGRTHHTVVTTLECWHYEKGCKAAAQSSWVDVGHRAPSGELTNDLTEPGNYPAALPVDDFLLLFEFPEQLIKPCTPGASWYASKEYGGARTQFSEMETNTTVSVGATAGGVSVDTSATFGMGWQNSNTVSWSESTMFAGGYSWGFDESHRCYYVVPYVYQATAKTLAGTTYPYWVMDYYVTELCD